MPQRPVRLIPSDSDSAPVPYTTDRPMLMFCLALALSFTLWMPPFPLAAQETSFDPQRLEKEVVVAACQDPMQLEVLDDGRILFIERQGSVKLHRPDPQAETLVVGEVPVAVFGEVGLLGLALDNSFAKTGWLYLFFCPQDQPDSLRLSRFTLRDDRLDLASEIKLLEYPIDIEGAIHMGGGLYMDDRGCLHLGTGDNSPPIPELPVDQRVGRELYDALRTSANSRDLRGKVLRIRPEPDGTYAIPDGNLFADPQQGRPEIFAMGVRNAFRLSVDEATGTVYWGDVGPNIDPQLELGPNGFDEINRATKAGNFGWPLFVGDNQAYRDYDFATRQPGKPFDARRPINSSRNNTGLRELPPPQPALIWYPSFRSERFPSLGSGGRSAMAGPVYHFDRYADSDVRLPQSFDGALFFYEWTRNWIKAAKVSDAGQLLEIRDLMPNAIFRKPIDLKLGPDGTLYVIEYGDKWGDNQDAQITRILYRRGNRPPIAKLTTDVEAGRHPLTVQLDATGSHDPDDHPSLRYQWQINGETVPNTDTANLQTTFDQPGTYRVTVEVSDPAGLTATASRLIRVGNSPPVVKFLEPRHGSFFDWDETIAYRLQARDAEDGSTDDQTIPSGRVLLTRQWMTRQSPLGTVGANDPGLDLMRNTTCFSCHTTKSQSAGPAYRQVARRYANDESARDQLARKIITGGTGTWGSKPMPAHPQHTLQETRLMVDWILSLARDESSAPVPGRHGFFRAARDPQSNQDSGVIRLIAEYTDQGAEGAPAIRGTRTCVLHTRRKQAAFFDRRQGIDVVDVFESQVGLVARFGPGDWIAFDQVSLADIDRVTWRVSPATGKPLSLTIRADAPDGPVLARLKATAESQSSTADFRNFTTPIESMAGVHDLYIVAEPNGEDSEAAADVPSQISLAWMEFHDSPAARQRKQQEAAPRKTIVLIPTQLDHPWATHMYTDGCRILAACLNETPGVEAIVSPDLDWPRDPALLERADAIVFYSRPAGDILLSPRYRESALKLLRRGVGFSAIHWATGAEADVGPEYQEILGGWFNFAHSGLKVDRQTLNQVAPDHPICRGWNPYVLRDEFYLNLKFSKTAEPILQVNVDGQDQTVAWVQQRADGGRSFGTTLGHFHDNYSVADFRKMLVNGILWTAGIEVPEAGANVDIEDALLKLPEPQRTVVQEWKLDDLESLLHQAWRQRDFARGEKLFQTASCADCHTLDGSGTKLGPDLRDLRVRLAADPFPRQELLRSILEPSHRIEPRYQSVKFQLNNGMLVSGLVKSRVDGQVHLISNPAKPNDVMQIDEADIEQEAPSKLSMMPTGLLNTLDREEIVDLLAYVEAGGQPDYVAFRRIDRNLESWANNELPVRQGLAWWLDASRMNVARETAGQTPLSDGQLVGEWPDGSGFGRKVRQRDLDAQPVFRLTDRGEYVELDGLNDLLTCSGAELRTRDLTAVMVVRIDHNRGWPGLISGNAWGSNDYQSGFNIDLMPEEAADFSSVMVEGPGFIGVQNLMRDRYPFGRFYIVTVSSTAGSGTVQLRINGRPQASRDRQAGLLRMDELTVGARYWSNDQTVPAFDRGFLAGGFSQVLLYDRVLSESEQAGLEAWLWDQHRGLLDVPPGN